MGTRTARSTVTLVRFGPSLSWRVIAEVSRSAGRRGGRGGLDRGPLLIVAASVQVAEVPAMLVDPRRVRQVQVAPAC
ncbi:MAG TPA: hypothetical protein VEL03_20620 [Streptosporangiaceae bacterium]|nr:hypothetical protein [Streptosporangiaceae bacterium]